MRKIADIIRTQNKTSAKGIPYTLYTYLMDDGSSVDSLKKYDIGQETEIWFDEKYNKSKIRVRNRCAKCNKTYKPEDAVQHEFCHQTRV